MCRTSGPQYLHRLWPSGVWRLPLICIPGGEGTSATCPISRSYPNPDSLCDANYNQKERSTRGVLTQVMVDAGYLVCGEGFKSWHARPVRAHRSRAATGIPSPPGCPAGRRTVCRLEGCGVATPSERSGEGGREVVGPPGGDRVPSWVRSKNRFAGQRTDVRGLIFQAASGGRGGEQRRETYSFGRLM